VRLLASAPVARDEQDRLEDSREADLVLPHGSGKIAGIDLGGSAPSCARPVRLRAGGALVNSGSPVAGDAGRAAEKPSNLYRLRRDAPTTLRRRMASA
jgi:hypothetical protein